MRGSVCTILAILEADMGMFSILPESVQVYDTDDALGVVEYLKTKPIIAVDTETTGLSRQKDRAIILALSDGESRWAIWPNVLPYFRGLL